MMPVRQLLSIVQSNLEVVSNNVLVTEKASTKA